MNVVASRELLLTADHLGLVLEYAAGGNLSTYVTSKRPRGQPTEMLYLSEDEARYYFRVFPNPKPDGIPTFHGFGCQ